jgi:outer membrane protein OmpA-like peptidoglycan-associated protein
MLNKIKILCLALVSITLTNCTMVEEVSISKPLPPAAEPMFRVSNLLSKHRYLPRSTIKSTKMVSLNRSDILYNLVSVFFANNKINILPNSKKNLELIVAAIVKNKPQTVYIEGFTDANGDNNYNYKLAEERVYTVYEALISYGIDPNIMLIKSSGENSPIASNSTYNGRQRNRRVDISF